MNATCPFPDSNWICELVRVPRAVTFGDAIGFTGSSAAEMVAPATNEMSEARRERTGIPLAGNGKGSRVSVYAETMMRGWFTATLTRHHAAVILIHLSAT